jgi:hypothetical protein
MLVSRQNRQEDFIMKTPRFTKEQIAFTLKQAKPEHTIKQA